MSSKAMSPIRNAWYNWKALRLPWRKRFLVGLDLQGNTFWEFRDTLNSHQHRMRRIVQYPPSTPLSEVQISPQWHQWLRHTRRDAPSLDEQSRDLVRQDNLKALAAQADARWAAKPSFLDNPGRARGQPLPALGGLDLGGNGRSMPSASTEGVKSTVRGNLEEAEGSKDAERPQDATREGAVCNGEASTEEPQPAVEQETPKNEVMQGSDDEKHHFNERPHGSRIEKKYKEDPWKQTRGAPSEEWQPQGWDPNVAAQKR